MADKKTEGDGSNNTKPHVNVTGAGERSPAPVSMPSPEHPPVFNVMPHPDVIPNEPLTVPPGPPVSNIMPAPPETKIELTVPPPPDFSQRAPEVNAPIATPEQSAAVPAKKSEPTLDAIEAEVGIVRPVAKSKPPDTMQTDMQRILKGIKLPEKRSFTPNSERKIAPVKTTASDDAQKLDDILSAHITENPILPASTSDLRPTPLAAPTVVPDQGVFHEDMQVASVHTLKQDLQHVVQEQKMSVVKAVALEQQKRQRQDHMVDQEPLRVPSRTPQVLFIVFIFFALGLAALGAVYYIAAVQSTPAPAAQTTSLVFAEQTVAFPLTQDPPESLKAQLAQSRNSSGTLGSLLHIVPVIPGVDASGNETQRPATLSEFFKSLGIEPPDNLMRALGDDFFLGIHTVDKNAPILVIKVTSYDRAFDGMLSWEKRMNGDLAPLFTSVPRLVMGSDGLQTERPFTDLVMRNYDVRALKDDQGVIQLYYSFPTRDLLVIAESPYTFTEILSRLQAGRRL